MAWYNLATILYPIGCIYISIDATSPASIFGGSWTKLNNSCILMNTSHTASALYDKQAAIGEYAGSAFITTAEMPTHRHGTSTAWGVEVVSGGLATSGNIGYVEWATGLLQSVPNPDVGGGERHYQYHYGVYMWRRTA